jgi:hypothetical protein
MMYVRKDDLVKFRQDFLRFMDEALAEGQPAYGGPDAQPGTSR